MVFARVTLINGLIQEVVGDYNALNQNVIYYISYIVSIFGNTANSQNLVVSLVQDKCFGFRYCYVPTMVTQIDDMQCLKSISTIY